MIGTGAVELDGGKEKRPGRFMEVLREILRFREVENRSKDKVDKV